ncbi:Hypothetical predicted protein [Podarcis lilfordi]|uniref:UPAR/Ly6 domain-containing protein n=1 Tax=Podarcis lilfordi TaxID=74358 RepID=A0AA35LFX7_9SAUR|nr:Hypothetical predicted protein [Podarcis lilfordi]
MNKLLSVGLWILLAFSMVNSLKCYTCLFELKNGTCPSPKPPCIAQSRESCFRQKLFTESVLLYTTAGCAYDCRDVNGGRHIHHVNKCCTTEMCNSP